MQVVKLAKPVDGHHVHGLAGHVPGDGGDAVGVFVMVKSVIVVSVWSAVAGCRLRVNASHRRSRTIMSISL